jgi:acetolactate decarboxylase
MNKNVIYSMRRHICATMLSFIMLTILAGCRSVGNDAKNIDELFQYSTLGSLMAGVFDGNIRCSELKAHGDVGLGTFNALDGEMIVIDQRIFQIKADGHVYAVSDTMKAPFATVTYFDADQTVTINSPMEWAQVKNYLDSLLPSKNIPYAIKITGRFSQMQTRSVPRQTKPYPHLLDVLKTQPTFDLRDIDGVMVGFRLPDYTSVINSPGHHFHFITADRKAGGHVLNCQVERATVAIDYTHAWQTVFPDDSVFYQTALSSETYR